MFLDKKGSERDQKENENVVIGKKNSKFFVKKKVTVSPPPPPPLLADKILAEGLVRIWGFFDHKYWLDYLSHC